jgi:hypothetical protein
MLIVSFRQEREKAKEGRKRSAHFEVFTAVSVQCLLGCDTMQ